MLSWLAPIVVFGLVVLVHELGHFLAAKAMGVYAPRFSIGFGPALFRRRWGETEYVLAALPLGGYVRMASRDDETMALIEGGGEHAPEVPHTVGGSGTVKVGEEHIGDGLRPADWDPEALVPFGPKPVPEHRWFESKRLPARLFILVAGVAMNVVLTFVVLTGAYVSFGQPYLLPVVDSVVAGMPAAAAGLRAGDRIVAVDGTPVARWSEVVERVTVAAGDTLAVQVRRGGTSLALRLVPAAAADTNPLTGEVRGVGRIGALADTAHTGIEPIGLPEAVARGAATTWQMGTVVFTTLKRLANGRESVSSLGGPIAIAQVSVQAARSGPENFVFLLALISINIGIFNLLPIPILDGGQIVLNVAESVKGRPFSVRTKELIARAGLAAIGLIFVLVMFNDIKRLLQSLLG
ncbi:MAG TPA: RIP metalloprotease RseP [Gemmatimonadaceae bacterium]|nr:RIP metalloprotease RseP [Gemmatimonadaceae bacterium]